MGQVVREGLAGTQAAATMRRALDMCFARKTDLTVDQWAEKEVVLSAQHGVPKAMGGPYRSSRTPYTRSPIRTLKQSW